MLITMNMFLIGTLWFSSHLLPIQATAETVRGVHRELDPMPDEVESSMPSPAPKEPKVELLTAGDYAILAKAGISTVPNSVITGNIGVSPIAATAMTGFSLSLDSTTQFATSTQVTGRAVAASYGAPISELLTLAVSAMEDGYTNAAGRLNPDNERKNLGALSGDTLTPGVYTFSGDVAITGDIYFEGTGEFEGETDVFIIQSAGNLVLSTGVRVHLTNGALAKNIFWQNAGFVQVAVGAHLEGILLCATKVVFQTNASLNGRILAQTAVTLDMATINDTEPSRMPSTEPSSKPSSVPSSIPSSDPTTFPSSEPSSRRLL
jgi:hypothetical protein